MATQQKVSQVVFRVIDGIDTPFGKRVLRLRLHEGTAPLTRQLKGARFRARSPQGQEETLRVTGFALAGGRPSDSRISRTGRVDVLVASEGEAAAPQAAARWELTGPL